VVAFFNNRGSNNVVTVNLNQGSSIEIMKQLEWRRHFTVVEIAVLANNVNLYPGSTIFGKHCKESGGGILDISWRIEPAWWRISNNKGWMRRYYN